MSDKDIYVTDFQSVAGRYVYMNHHTGSCKHSYRALSEWGDLLTSLQLPPHSAEKRVDNIQANFSVIMFPTVFLTH